MVAAAVVWGILRYLQGSLTISAGGLALLIVLGIFSGLARSWVGLRDPRVMFSFTVPLATMDLLIISLAVRLTGGFQSEAWLLYFALLVSESAVMTQRGWLIMHMLMGVGYLLAVYPIPPDLWTNFGFRVAMVSQTSWLIFQVLRGHLEYRMELAELREQVELSQERERIAREFHDGLGNTLVNVIRGLELLALRFRKQVAEATEAQIHELTSLVRSALDETRQMIRQLNPKTPPDICQQITQMAERTAERLNAQLHLDCPSSAPNLSPLQSLMLTQVVKEALSNALKHAGQPQNLWVQFRVSEGALEGCIRDDGDGFDPQRILEGYGMHHMEERIRSLGGDFEIDSAPGQGTTVRFRIPLEK